MKVLETDSYNEIPNNFTGIVKTSRGSLIYFKNGKRHREDGPAVIWYNRSSYYYLNDNCYGKDRWQKKVIKNTTLGRILLGD